MDGARSNYLAEAEQETIKQQIEQIVAELQVSGRFSDEGYLRQDRLSYLRDMQDTITNRWASAQVQERFSHDLVSFAAKVAIAYDKYALELYGLLLPSDPEKPQTSGLYRTAQNQINKFGTLRASFDPEDALHSTWEAIMGPRMALLNFDGRSSLQTWVWKILGNEIRQEARRRGLIRTKPDATDAHLNNSDGALVPQILSLDREMGEGGSLLNVVHESKARQPEEALGHREWLRKRVQFLQGLISSSEQEAKLDSKGKITSPSRERGWVLWDDYLADFYVELAELEANQEMLASPPFPFPPKDAFPPERKGQHDPAWSDYLARMVGQLRQWPREDIDEDLAQPRSPKDTSRLRAVVRIRRNEGKVALAEDLRHNP